MCHIYMYISIYSYKHIHTYIHFIILCFGGLKTIFYYMVIYQMDAFPKSQLVYQANEELKSQDFVSVALVSGGKGELELGIETAMCGG